MWRRSLRREFPKILWVFSGVPITKELIERWRPYVGNFILWWSCRRDLHPGFPFDQFDAIFTCIPSLAKMFEKKGIRARHLAHAFDPRALRGLQFPEKRRMGTVFAGSLNISHRRRIAFLDRIAREVHLDFYGSGNGLDLLPADSPLRLRKNEAQWGKELYLLYGSYFLGIHMNTDIAGREASAKRMFEAAGPGLCLLTDGTEGLEDYFEPGREMISYAGVEDCIDMIRWLERNPHEAEQVGARARKKVLSRHTYSIRTKQFLNHLEDLGLL